MVTAKTKTGFIAIVTNEKYYGVIPPNKHSRFQDHYTYYTILNLVEPARQSVL